MEAELIKDRPILKSEEIIEKAKITEEAGTASFMDPKIKEPKKSRGRPKKSENEKTFSAKTENKEQDKPKFEIPTQALCYPILKAVSVGAVNYTKDVRAALTADEADAMAASMGMVIDKYMPDAMSKWGPEIVLGMNFGQYALRLYALKRSKDEEAFKKAREAQEIRPNTAEGQKMTGINEETPVP